MIYYTIRAIWSIFGLRYEIVFSYPLLVHNWKEVVAVNWYT